MTNHPFQCSAAWTTEERSAYVTWMAQMSLDRIDRDDPAMPVLAKAPIRSLFETIYRVLTWPAARLEENRAALMKPYDPSKDQHSVWMVS